MDGHALRSRLTAREIEVAALIAAGYTNGEIAAKLSISVRTVTAHVQNIFNKLGVQSRAEVASWSTRQSIGPAPAASGLKGLIAPPAPKETVVRPKTIGFLTRPIIVPIATAAMALIAFIVVYGGLRPRADPKPASGLQQVVVAPNQPIEIAVVLPVTGDSVVVGVGAWNSVQLAVAKQPKIKGFSVKLKRFNGPCGPDAGVNVNSANQVVASMQNVAVIGHFCSDHMSEVLPIYQSAGIATLSGSASNPLLADLGTTVFNSVVVSDGCCPFQDRFGPWYLGISKLPSDLTWRHGDYASAFGAPPPDYADLYYDAASIVLRQIAAVASLDDSGNLIIRRPALAHALRTTSGFHGVTCDVTFASTGFRLDDPVSFRRCSAGSLS